MNKQRKVLITTTYNEMGIIIDTKAEEVAQPDLQPTCNNLATDTISRQAAIDAANDWFLDCFNIQKQDRSCGLIRRLEDLPTVEPRAKGKWDFIGDNMFMCTSCGAIYTVQQLECLKQRVTDLYIPPYCPNCGADMREETE